MVVCALGWIFAVVTGFLAAWRHARKMGGHASGNEERCAVTVEVSLQPDLLSITGLSASGSWAASLYQAGRTQDRIPRYQSQNQADELISVAEGVDEIFYEVPGELEIGSPACMLKIAVARQLDLFESRVVRAVLRLGRPLGNVYGYVWGVRLPCANQPADSDAGAARHDRLLPGIHGHTAGTATAQGRGIEVLEEASGQIDRRCVFQSEF